MLAQITLIPTESKKLIAMAVAQMNIIKRAPNVVMHPSSSTYFIVEELTGRRVSTNMWASGIVVPKGTCLEMGSQIPNPSATQPQASEASSTIVQANPVGFRSSWVVRDNKFVTGLSLEELFDLMGPDDVYIKGANAIDVSNTVGVLIGNLIEAGTIGRVAAASKNKGFKLVFPVGLEKLIPGSIREASRHAKKFHLSYSMGIACNLFPCEGIVVTELQAINILSGANATVISAGGVGGAEGAVTMVIEGEDNQVKDAVRYAEKAKGAKLPEVRTKNCYDCGSKLCSFPVVDKAWA